jgi:5-methylcytosine-specific restriction protein A
MARLRRCLQPGCGALTPNTRCPEHTKARELERRGNLVSGWEWTTIAARIKRRDEYRCTEVIDGERCNSSVDIEVDHEIPLAAGGTNDDDNLRTRCRDCHLRKHGKAAA